MSSRVAFLGEFRRIGEKVDVWNRTATRQGRPPRGGNHRREPRYNTNKRRNGRGEGAEERAITCDQYARLRSVRRRFSS